MGKFPSRMFRWAAIYGVIVLTPMYFTPLPELGAEVLLGFVGLATMTAAARAQGAPLAWSVIAATYRRLGDALTASRPAVAM